MQLRFIIALVVGFASPANAGAEEDVVVGFLTTSTTLAEAENWQGIYVGGGLPHTDFHPQPLFSGSPLSAGIDPSGTGVSGFGGYRFKWGPVVAGLEAGLTLGGDSKDNRNGELSDAFEHNYSLSLGGRLGYSFQSLMPYAKAGVVRSRFDSTLRTGSGDGGETKTSNTFDGYFLGVGVIWLIRENLSARLEYQNTEYDDAPIAQQPGNRVPSDPGSPPGGSTINLGVALQF